MLRAKTIRPAALHAQQAIARKFAETPTNVRDMMQSGPTTAVFDLVFRFDRDMVITTPIDLQGRRVVQKQSRPRYTINDVVAVDLVHPSWEGIHEHIEKRFAAHKWKIVKPERECNIRVVSVVWEHGGETRMSKDSWDTTSRRFHDVMDSEEAVTAKFVVDCSFARPGKEIGGGEG